MTCCNILKEFYCPSGGDDYVLVFLREYKFYSKWLRFFPALLLTISLELVNSFSLNLNADWLQQHFILVSFIPVISAISGNIGLQISSSITSLINVKKQRAETIEFGYIFRNYFGFTMINVFFVSCIIALLAYFIDKGTCTGDHTGIIFAGSIINMTIAAFMGIMTPYLSNKMNYDPSAIAGPFETAIQDIIGFAIFLIMAKNIIEYFPPNTCELGNCVTFCDNKHFDFYYQCILQCQKDFECIKNCIDGN